MNAKCQFIFIPKPRAQEGAKPRIFRRDFSKINVDDAVRTKQLKWTSKVMAGREVDS